MRVYNLLGRRDNKYKGRIKILVHETGAEEFTRLVEEEFARIDAPAVAADPRELERIWSYFATPAYEDLPERDRALDLTRLENREFDFWVRANISDHKVPGYAIANISLKPIGGIPGDATGEQMRVVADLADRYSFGEIRVTHEQNLVLPSVKQSDLFAVWEGLREAELATANIGLVTDIISCPGLDYCALASRALNPDRAGDQHPVREHQAPA